MASILDPEAIHRKTMVLFFMIDASGSMAGSKMGAVNTAISEVIPEIKDISSNNPDAMIKVAAMQFSSGCSWVTSAPVEAMDFVWNDLTAGGLTDFGVACKELDQKLSRTSFMNQLGGAYAPVIILLSDGEPTDDYVQGLGVLKLNNWYKAAIKIAIAIGDDANIEVLKEFTGNNECVVTVYNPTMLKKMIRFASVTASKIGSQSRATGDDSSKQTDMANAITAFTNNNNDVDDLDPTVGW